jgi:drug/metabolite transporter (DMT)-like permease
LLRRSAPRNDGTIVIASEAKQSTLSQPKPHRLAFPALLLGNAALACGPWLVRLADVGPVAVGFWRLFLALPLLFVIARISGQRPHWPRRAMIGTIAIAALFYSADLAGWNAGIRMTKLGNATLFGNFASFGFAAYGLWLARRRPTTVQGVALTLAAAGCVMLMAGSAELSLRNLHGDLLALMAGLLYAGYLIFIERARTELEPLPALLVATLFSAALLLPLSLALGEQIWPRDWGPLLIIALTSQVIGQGLLVYSIGTLSPLVVGLALLTQPAIAAAIGWIFYDERLSTLDWIGALAIAAALVLVRMPQRDLRSGEEHPS